MAHSSKGKPPFSGVRIIDLGHKLAGPLAAMLFADQGADVLHIDRPGNDLVEGDSLDAVLQRNKSRMTIDLKTSSGQMQLFGLVKDADVLINNFRPGTMLSLGLSYEICRAVNPGLIYLSLPGFASTDEERAGIAGWEGVVGAAAGLFTNISFTREFLHLPPVFTALPLPSVYGAVHGAIAVAMALIARQRTGLRVCNLHTLIDLALTS